MAGWTRMHIALTHSHAINEILLGHARHACSASCVTSQRYSWHGCRPVQACIHLSQAEMDDSYYTYVLQS